MPEEVVFEAPRRVAGKVSRRSSVESKASRRASSLVVPPELPITSSKQSIETL
jgi:hypothetical protein